MILKYDKYTRELLATQSKKPKCKCQYAKLCEECKAKSLIQNPEDNNNKKLSTKRYPEIIIESNGKTKTIDAKSINSEEDIKSAIKDTMSGTREKIYQSNYEKRFMNNKKFDRSKCQCKYSELCDHCQENAAVPITEYDLNDKMRDVHYKEYLWLLDDDLPNAFYDWDSHEDFYEYPLEPEYEAREREIYGD